MASGRGMPLLVRFDTARVLKTHVGQNYAWLRTRTYIDQDTLIVGLFLYSSRMQAWKNSSDDGGGGPRPLHQVQGDIPATADTTRIGGTTQNLW